MPVMKAVVMHLDRFICPEPDSLLFCSYNGQPLSVGVLQRAWTKARLSAGLPDLHLHDYADLRVMPTSIHNSSSPLVNDLKSSA
jgi:hypothetical protein